MTGVPPIHFARSHGASIAYQVVGSGSPTIVAIPPMAQNIELAWEWPALRYMFERLGSFSRFAHFDKRGTGMSDRGLDIPGIDERVDELRAVMDSAEIESAYLFGQSEGGPMSLLFAATYPDRVDGLVLNATGATLMTDEERAARSTLDETVERFAAMTAFADRWGTPESLSVDLFAPSLVSDTEFRAWFERYERQCANRDAILTLLKMNGSMDVRDVLDRIEVPVLMLHRTDDRVIPVERGRDTAERLSRAGSDVRFVEFPGHDHFMFAGDLDSMLDEIERFVTGTVSHRQPRSTGCVEVSTLGAFEVLVDGSAVPTSVWGSRRARTLLKRLVVARGWPVTRDELTDLLWPDETDPQRLGARLSVQLSAVRRVLGGGVVADRSSIRLDLDEIDVDLERWFGLDDDDSIVDGYSGELLPDDRYEDWSAAPREEARARFLTAAGRVIDEAVRDGDDVRVIDIAQRVIVADPFHDAAHLAMIASLSRSGSHGAAADAHLRYVGAMAEVGVEPEPLSRITDD